MHFGHLAILDLEGVSLAAGASEGGHIEVHAQGLCEVGRGVGKEADLENSQHPAAKPGFVEGYTYA